MARAHYAPTRKSLSGHPVPAWFEDAKLGVFIHWGLFSVPAFAPRLAHVSDAFTQHYPLSAVMTPYTEWYDNAIRVPESPSARHHHERWADRPYEDFVPDFRAGLAQWDPAAWARLFRRAGARYVVLVTKHHDGYCLWPSRVSNPNRPGWATERDIVGELAAAVRAEGLRFGVYYSGGIDWTFHREPVRTLVEFIGSVPGGDYPAYAEAQVRELIERVEPSILWNDIAWPTGEGPLLKLMADYYDAVPEGVVNDRWMHRGWALKALSRRPVQKLLDRWLARRIARDAAGGKPAGGIVPPIPAHCDFRTPEYTSFDTIQKRKWEATRGLTPSFGFNHRDEEADHEAPDELVRSFVDTVSKNGNLLINVGPRGADAAIPDAQASRLEALGSWLAREGEAIYGSRPATTAEGVTEAGVPVRFTRNEETLYAIAMAGVSGEPDAIELPDAPSVPELVVTRLADGERHSTRAEGKRVQLPRGAPTAGPATAFAIHPAPS